MMAQLIALNPSRQCLCANIDRAQVAKHKTIWLDYQRDMIQALQGVRAFR